MNNTSFSVALCVYNGDHPGCFEIALKSVINQTVRPSEIVLTIDGPINSYLESIVEKYVHIAEQYCIDFKIVRLERNMGHGEARRISILNSSNAIVAIMDADDISLQDRFEKQINYLIENPDISIVGGHICEFFNSEDPVDVSRKAGIRTVPIRDLDIKQYMRYRCPMNQVTVMFRKEDILSVGSYQDWYCNEDYYLWIRLYLAGYKFGNIDDVLVNVRVDDSMYKRRGGVKYFISESKLQLYMFNNKMIRSSMLISNVLKRFVVQMLIPNRYRHLFYKYFARQSG